MVGPFLEMQKSGPNGTTNFVYDGSNAIEELDSLGNVLARYTQGKGIDEPLAELRSGILSFYESDTLGSVTSLTNPAATITATYGYDTFGNLLASTGSLTNPFRYTAREADAETGLYYHRARFYDPTLGRFLSGDQIGNDEGSNLYTYVRNAPIQFRDPTGLYRLWHFPDPEHEQKMRDAIQSAIDTLQKKQKDCKDGCAGSLGPKIIQALQDADYLYVPNLQNSKGEEECGDARPLPSRIIHIGSAAFNAVRCCRLAATLAHEATHKATQSNDEGAPGDVEEKCFGCH